MNDPVIALPDFSGDSTFELNTDASDLGLGAILVQIDKNGVEKVLQYGSRRLTKDELKWHTQEKEALAIVWGCGKFRAYLLGTPFIIRTDHHSLQWIMKSEKGRLARWALSLSEFDFQIKHRPGTKNVNGNVASRWTKVEPDDNWDPFPYYADPTTRDENPKSILCIKCNKDITTWRTPTNGINQNKPLLVIEEQPLNIRDLIRAAQQEDINVNQAISLVLDGKTKEEKRGKK
jgi:hypothetical protein